MTPLLGEATRFLPAGVAAFPGDSRCIIPLRSELLDESRLTVFPFGLRNDAGDWLYLASWPRHPPPVSDEFVGMADYMSDSLYDLLEEEASDTNIPRYMGETTTKTGA